MVNEKDRIELKMRLRDKVMRKGNVTNWMAILCFAVAAIPAAAQQATTPNAVRNMLKPPAPAAAPAAAPGSVQNPRPAATAARPVTSEPKPVFGPTAPAASSPERAGLKPIRNTAPSETAAATKGAPIKPAAGPDSRPEPSAKPATEARADIPKTVPTPAVQPVKENVARRDPFSPLIAKDTGGGGAPQNLPPGKPGLMISGLHIDGIVSGPSGMIAIVSNAQERVYFLREGDHLYDGQVQHITMDGISFHQTGKDPFGNAVEREVAKRLNPTPGEQQ